MSSPIFQECCDLNPVGSVVWRFDRAYLKPAHYHGQLEVLFVRRGAASLQLGTETHRIQAGTLAWILPGTSHEVRSFSEDFDMWVIHCEPERATEALLGTSTVPGSSPFSGWMRDLINACGASPVLTPDPAAFENLEKRCGDAHRRLFMASSKKLIDELLLESLAASKTNTNRGLPSVPFLASSLVAEDLELTRDELCSQLAIGPAHLARVAKGAWGHGFAEHRSRSRVASFLNHCRTREINLLEAGLDSGFHSYSQLHRTFRQITGWRPRDYVLGDGREKLAKSGLAQSL